MFFITHDNREAVRLGTHVVVMGTRPGRIKTVLEIEEDLPRPRQALDRNLNVVMAQVARHLQAEVDKVAREEFDDGLPESEPAKMPETDLGRDI